MRRPLISHRRHSLAVTAMLAAAGLVDLRSWTQHPPRFEERVNVARVLVDARVLDDRGNPLPGLTARDFRISIDGKPARVETATWVGERESGREMQAAEGTRLHGAGPMIPGRLIVFLFQKDLEPSRIVGLMRMLLKSRNFLETLAPADRVAIVSFDSHLKIWTDFTTNRELLERVLARGVLFERPPAKPEPSTPSLVKRIDPDMARRAYGIERTLELIAEALEPLPGAKSLVLVGHGFGRFTQHGVAMERNYAPARRALLASRTSVFALDVTQADYHSLDSGLQLISRQTGGFYARTHVFPDRAMHELSGALAGYYVLFVEVPDDRRRATHDIDVELTRHRGRVLAASSYSDRTRWQRP